jgi:hypothetical protein
MASFTLALVPSEIIETTSEMADYYENVWQETLMQAANAIRHSKPEHLDAIAEDLETIWEQQLYVQFLRDKVGEMQQFSTDVWPALDRGAQEFIAHLFWLLRGELPDFSSAEEQPTR